MFPKKREIKRYFNLISTRVLINLKDPEANKKRKTFSVFLILATVFWFLNSLNENYPADIEYPVRFINMPDNKVLTSKLPEFLTVRVFTTGYDIIGIKSKSTLNTLKIDYKDLNIKNDTFTGKTFFLTNSVLNSLSKQIPQNVKILDIIPDTLFFTFAQKMKKRVPVNTNINTFCSKMHMLSAPVRFFPDSVEIYGIEGVVDTFTFVELNKTIFSELFENTEKYVALKKYEGINYNTNVVKLVFGVERYTEKQIYVEVLKKNVPDSLDLKIIPEKVSVSFIVPINKYRLINEKNFELSVDFEQTKNSDNSGLEVILNKKPENIQSLKISPSRLDYIIFKNQAISNSNFVRLQN